MSRAYNFSAGPATLPEAVLRQAQEEMLEWRDARASIVELSHRGPEFMQVAAEAVGVVRDHPLRHRPVQLGSVDPRLAVVDDDQQVSALGRAFR